MPGLVIAIAAGWVAIGLVLSIVMGRRGHDSFGWLVTGTLLGPLAVVLAIDARRRAEQLDPANLRKGPPAIASSGPIDVLVGFDGSPESRAAIDTVPTLLDDRLELLHGQPAAALSEYAAEGGYSLIAVGTRGAGITKAILGSAATQLAEHSKVPVLLVTAERRSAGAD